MRDTFSRTLQTTITFLLVAGVLVLAFGGFFRGVSGLLTGGLVGEMLRDPETPRPVVINEALELARTFSADDSVKFINGMLDAIRRKLDEGRE